MTYFLHLHESNAHNIFIQQGYQIPKGWIVYNSIACTQKDTDLFLHKDQFKPERWFSFIPDKSTNYHYLPFGSGPRGCVGKEFARLVMRLFLIYFVSTCTWEIHNPNPKFEWMMNSMAPADGLPISIRPYNQY